MWTKKRKTDRGIKIKILVNLNNPVASERSHVAPDIIMYIITLCLKKLLLRLWVCFTTAVYEFNNISSIQCI